MKKTQKTEKYKHRDPGKCVSS